MLRPGAVARVAAVVAAVVGVTTVLSTQAAKGPTTHAPSPMPGRVRAPTTRTSKQLRTLRVLQLGGRPPRGTGIGSYGVNDQRALGDARNERRGVVFGGMIPSLVTSYC